MSSSFPITFLRLSLGFIFLWFGLLKLFNVSPVLPVIQNSLPEMLGESQLFLFALSLLEITVGLGFLFNKFVKVLSCIMIGHLLVATVSVLFTQGFAPRFPILSFAGEFVLKNLVLIAAGLVLISSHKQPMRIHGGETE